MNTFNWCNTAWTAAMENGRQIHTGQPWMWYDPDQVLPESETSILLFAEKRPARIHHWDGNTYNPTVACGILRSVEKFGYGRFSAEIQLPRGRNLWPSFWLVGEGEPWPKCGEIDIMEGWTNQFGGYFRLGIPQPPYLLPNWGTTTNIHYEENGEHGYAGSRRLPIIFSLKRPAHNFVKYEVEWRLNTIAFFVNGHRVRTYGWEVAQHLLNKKMHVIFDLWTTGFDYTLETPMMVRNFKYEPIEVL